MVAPDSFAAYVAYLLSAPPQTDDAAIADAYHRGDPSAVRTVEAVWAVNRARVDATRRLAATADACGRACVRRFRARLNHARTGCFARGGGGSNHAASAVAAAHRILSHYPTYLRAVAAHDRDAFDVDAERTRFERMCATCARLADESGETLPLRGGQA